MSAIACCVQGCGAKVCFDEAVEHRLRRTHEWWMCPFGHRQHFITKTDEEVRIERLERELGYAHTARDRWRRHHEEQQTVFCTCPFCGWQSGAGLERRWLSLLRHFDKAHRELLTGARGMGSFVWAMRQAEAERESA